MHCKGLGDDRPRPPGEAQDGPRLRHPGPEGPARCFARFILLRNPQYSSLGKCSSKLPFKTIAAFDSGKRNGINRPTGWNGPAPLG